jgi:hypothetical protein
MVCSLSQTHKMRELQDEKEFIRFLPDTIIVRFNIGAMLQRGFKRAGVCRWKKPVGAEGQ